MSSPIGSEELSRMIAGAAALVREQHARLSELDCAAGDGDHGSSMLRIVDRLEGTFASGAEADLKTRFREAGWNVLCADGGASSSLLGAFFLGMADGVAEGLRSLDLHELSRAFEAGLEAVRKQTKAQPGDKTLMDALTPAVAALSAAAIEGRDVILALEEAARAAQTGADATKDFTARFGRARFLGDKTLGHADPGAASVALLFEGFRRGLAGGKGESRNA